VTVEIIQFPKSGLTAPKKPVATHGALLPSPEVAAMFSPSARSDGRRWYGPIWPGEENDWGRDGYTIIAI